MGASVCLFEDDLLFGYTINFRKNAEIVNNMFYYPIDGIFRMVR